jgi:HD-GYP domain-containing protein (c-di-GMP phosphodiesterase class II)
MSETPAPAATIAGSFDADACEGLARQFLMTLAQIVSVCRFHQIDNEAVRIPIALLSEWTRVLCAAEQKFTIFGEDGQVFVNQKRVRFTGGSFETIQKLLRGLEERGLAGLEFRAPVDTEELRSFLTAFQSVNRQSADAAGDVERAVASAGVRGIAVLRPGGQRQGSNKLHSLDDAAMAALLYAKAVVLLRETIRNWDDETTRNQLGARSTRIIQGIITLAERDRRPFLWLLQVKNEREYLFTHGANVALLCILVGLRLGIDRNRLCDLGAAALFHDLGHICLPPEVRTKTGLFSEEDYKAMALHPIHGTNLLLKLKNLQPSLLARIVVNFEHNIASNGYPRKSWPRGEHVFSRIVAVANAYDAMTTRRSYRHALTPDEALRELWKHAGTRYDSGIVHTFANVVGLYPLGTLVRLSSGEEAVVYHVDPSAPRHPVVKIVRAADGSRPSVGRIVDLAERDASGACANSIVGMVDALASGVNPSAFLWESENQ